MNNIYEVQFQGAKGIETKEIVSRGFSVDAQGNLIFKNRPDGGVVAMFVHDTWFNFVVVDKVPDAAVNKDE